jgi:formylglycine-generating enzyme required for sulfatase activity
VLLACVSLGAYLGFAYVPDNLDFVPLEQQGARPADKPAAPLPKRSGARHELVVSSINYRMVYIPAGTFMMGTPKNHPSWYIEENQHPVTLTKGFHMGNSSPNYTGSGNDCPAAWVSWNDVQEFIRKLNALEKTVNFRLPTSAEWEYACSAGSPTQFGFGDDERRLGEYAWYDRNSGNSTHPVAQKKPNSWGLYDMHGNVWEWCEDWYYYYPSGPATDPKGYSPVNERRVVRGGGYKDGQPKVFRSAYRLGAYPNSKTDEYGFRFARTE